MTKTNYLTPCWRGYESVPGKEVYTKGSCKKIGGKGADDDDDIDFDDIKWGKFTDQLNRYNSQNKKKTMTRFKVTNVHLRCMNETNKNAKKSALNVLVYGFFHALRDRNTPRKILGRSTECRCCHHSTGCNCVGI